MNYALSAVLAVLAALCGAEPLKFTESTAEPLGKKIRWTVPMEADLSDSDGFEFDFRCTNRGQFGRMSMYVFCAGAGKSSCYAVKVPIDAADDWAHVVVRKRMVYNTENHPDGWADVRSFQLTSRLVGTNGVTAWVRDWRPLPKATAAAAIIVPEKAMSDEGMLAKGRFGVHERISAAFDTLGVPSYYLSDHDLARGVPANAKLLVLQGDETLFGEAVRSLETFLTRGGRIVVWRRVKDAALRKVRDAHRAQFVVAEALRERATNCAEVLGPIARAHLPELAAAMAAREAANAAKLKREADAIAAMPPKAEDFRVATCHNPWGKTDDWDWDVWAKALKDCGFTHLSVNLCRGVYAAYGSKVLKPWPGMATKGDALEKLKAACAKHGLKLTAWRCCWATPEWLGTKEVMEELRASGQMAVGYDGKEIVGKVCPSCPEAYAREVECLKELAGKGVSGIDLDYIRYHSEQMCFCGRCRAAFEKRLGHPVANWPKDVREGLRQAWEDFRADNITRVVKAVGEYVHAHHPDVKVRVYGFTEVVSARANVGQDWPYWCRRGWVDEVSIMDYETTAADLRAALLRQRKIDAGRAVLHPILGPSCWTDVGDDAWRTAEQVRCVRECGYPGWGLFDLDARTLKICRALATGPTAIGQAGSPPKQADIGDVLRASVAAGDVAGVVSVVSSPDYSMRIDCAGHADVERKIPMRPDTVFALFSCSKSVCGTAVMILVGEGKLGLDDPVAKYIPEFADVKVEEKGRDGKTVLVSPKRPVTVRDVMSHVSGSRFQPPIIRRDFPLVECARRMAKTPFKFQPGETFSYNNAGIDTGGAVVEVVSGMDFESFCQVRIFRPLGMKDTTFTPNADQIARLARCYNADGRPFADQAKAGAKYAGRPYGEQTLLPAPWKVYPAPSAGLYSTPLDFSRYSQMLAHHGEWQGVRLIPEKLFRETYAVKQTADAIESPYTIGNWIRGEWFGHSGAMKSDQRVNVRTGHSRCYFAQIMPPGGEGFERSKDAWNLAVDAIQCAEGATPCLDHSTKRTSGGKVKTGR